MKILPLLQRTILIPVHCSAAIDWLRYNKTAKLVILLIFEHINVIINPNTRQISQKKQTHKQNDVTVLKNSRAST